jgi:hypothetical protein
MSEQREQAIEAIIEAARRTRTPTPRWLWILAAVIGIGCAAAFVIALVSGGDGTSHPPPAARGNTGVGFASGIAIGLAAGIAIGYAIARQVRDHSSRSKP